MAAQLKDLVREVREIYQDAVPPYRVSDAELARYAWEAMTTFRRIRPDFRLGTTAPDLASYDGATLTFALPSPFGEDYFSAMVDYVAARAMQRDDQLGDESTAMALLAKVTAAVQSTGV